MHKHPAQRHDILALSDKLATYPTNTQIQNRLPARLARDPRLLPQHLRLRRRKVRHPAKRTQKRRLRRHLTQRHARLRRRVEVFAGPIRQRRRERQRAESRQHEHVAQSIALDRLIVAVAWEAGDALAEAGMLDAALRCHARAAGWEGMYDSFGWEH